VTGSKEIAATGMEQYHEAGGGDYLPIPCLNVDEAWIDGMATIVGRELAGWD